MKRSWLSAIIICLLFALCIVRVVRLGFVPPSQCSEVYKTYAGAADVKASYVKNFRLNDTLTVNVTVLAAETDSAFTALLSDFNRVIPYFDTLPKLHREYSTIMWRAPKTDYSEPPDSTNCINNDIFSSHLGRRVIVIFHIETNEQYDVVSQYIFDKAIE